MQAQTARRAQLLLALAILIAATYLLGLTWSFVSQFLGTFMLLFFAWLLAYLFKPVVAGITRVGLPFGGAVLLVYIVGPLVALVLGVLLVPAITEQAAGINAHLDEYTSKVSGLLNGAHGALTSFGLSAPDVGELEARVKGAAGSAGQAVLQGALNAVGGIGNALFQISLVLIFSVSFLVDGEQMARKARAALPERWRAGATFLVRSIEESFGRFVRGQLVSALAYAVLTAAVMLVFGLPNVAVSSLVAGLLVIVPLVGNYLAYIPPLVTCLVARADQTLILLAVVVAVQAIYMNILSPHIMARAVHMHPLVTMVSILVFGQVGGFWGAFLGIPITATLGMLAQPTLRVVDNYLNPAADGQRHAPSEPAASPGPWAADAANKNGPAAPEPLRQEPAG